MADASTDPANLLVIAAASESAAEFDISDPELLRMLESSQRSHFWFRARNRQILDFLRRAGVSPPSRVLEVGCGTGTVLSALAEAGYAMTGLEMHRELARRAAAANPRVPIFCANLFPIPAPLLAGGGFDAVGLFDVVEHLDNPEIVLRACASLLRPGGVLVGTVPALSLLWSDYDVFAGHRLRFDRGGVRSLFARARLPRPRAAYFLQTLLPGMLLRRILIGREQGGGDAGRRKAQRRGLSAPGPLPNRLLGAACDLERAVRRAVPLDAVPGSSIWFAATITDPGKTAGETRPTARTGGAR